MTLRVGIIGTGYGARVHAPILQKHPDYQLAALASLRPGRARQAVEALADVKPYDDWTAMIREAGLDLVVIAANPAEHAAMTLAALSANLHVLCEKPPALHLGEALAMRDAAAISGRVAAMNFEWRYLPERTTIARVLAEGSLGAIFHVRWSEAATMWPKIRDQQHKWFWSEPHGGGFFGAVGSHMIDALRHWFGPFTQVQGDTVSRVHSRLSEDAHTVSTADDSFTLHGRFAQGGSCTLEFTGVAVGREPRIEIFGSQGTLVLEGETLTQATIVAPEYQPVEPEKTMDVSGFAQEIQRYVHPQWTLYTQLARKIHGSTEASATVPTLDDAAYVQAVMDTVRLSAKSGFLPIPPLQ